MSLLRTAQARIASDLRKKMVLLAGPRQVGKTTLARGLAETEQTVYLNYDSVRDRRLILKEEWDTGRRLVILDELHKLRGWKSWLKGVWDTRRTSQQILVTGSARLDFVRRSGESLAGRYFLHRLHPLTVPELLPVMSADAAVDRLLRLGGFPEPLLSDSEEEARRWRLGHVDRILREDMIELERVQQIGKLELLLELLAERVGSPVSYSSLAGELQVSPKTVKSWIGILENLYVVFAVRPFSRSVSRSLLKEPKVYFYDVARVAGDGPRLENLVACHLLSRVHALQDRAGLRAELHYIRDKEKREVDFAVAVDRVLRELVEVKTADESVSRALLHFSERFPEAASLQVVRAARRTRLVGPCRVVSAAEYLSSRGLDSPGPKS